MFVHWRSSTAISCLSATRGKSAPPPICLSVRGGVWRKRIETEIHAENQNPRLAENAEGAAGGQGLGGMFSPAGEEGALEGLETMLFNDLVFQEQLIAYHQNAK